MILYMGIQAWFINTRRKSPAIRVDHRIIKWNVGCCTEMKYGDDNFGTFSITLKKEWDDTSCIWKDDYFNMWWHCHESHVTQSNHQKTRSLNNHRYLSVMSSCSFALRARDVLLFRGSILLLIPLYKVCSSSKVSPVNLLKFLSYRRPWIKD